jgi:hypothetical protein
MRRGLTFENVHNFLSGFLADDVRAKRVYSLANATLGVMSSASLAVNTIGQGLALARGGNTKHAIKQVDRLLSNQGIEVGELHPCGCAMWSARGQRSSSPWIGQSSSLTATPR